MLYRPLLSVSFAFIALVGLPDHAAAQTSQLVPESFRLKESARHVIDAEWLTDMERSDLRLFHGVWDERDLVTLTQQAQVALDAWKLDDPILVNEDVPAVIRSEAKFLRGDLEEAIELLEGDTSFRAARIRAEAWELLGRYEDANHAVDEPVKALKEDRIDNAADLTDAVRTLMVRARVQGQPARDFQSMMDLLGRAHQELDRHYWPAKLAEAQLLGEKDNQLESLVALHETLTLNPRCSAAWYDLGRAALARFDFDSAAIAAEALRRQNVDHPLADMLLAESSLIRDDPERALELLEPLTLRLPRLRPALALIAAARALNYDEASMLRALAAYEALSPDSGYAHYVVGRHLSFNRQYEAAAEVLEEAVRQKPAWPTPRIELGLMELQSGRESRALEALEVVVELDPFNKRAANSLFLLQEMAGYEQIETEHFFIRYKPGIDQVLAEMMPERLERIHGIVSGRFEFEPDRKTVIEIMPDHRRFAVRITGMPWIHTVAACTGPVIALEVPREGRPSEHLGLFDWPRVIQHEYTHTITLAQTQNRIPHWLTEAAAVSMEQAPRAYETCNMLAESFHEGTLFDLDEIKWAFVRPEKPGDRSKAYAQGHWMVEFMNERFGDSALNRLMDLYFEGVREQEAIPKALGISRDEFFDLFIEWARDEVIAWGLAPDPSLTDLTDKVRWLDPEMAVMMAASQQARADSIVKRLTEQIGAPKSQRRRTLRAKDWPQLVRPPVEVTEEMLARWLGVHPEHPDLLELELRRRMEIMETPDVSLVPDLKEYAAVRPVDPMPHKRLAQIWLASDTPERAIEHLEFLDSREDKSPVYALKLAELYRAEGDRKIALQRATRALHISPYHAPTRELVAALALEKREYDAARQHIHALTLIEPDRPRHKKRLEAIDNIIAGEN